VRINPYLPASFATLREARDQIVPTQPVARAPDPVRDQRRASEQLVLSLQERQHAESLLPKDGEAATRVAPDPRARKALEAYASVTHASEREYVSRVLGFDEFA
jgi:hypothetical protein